jgi:hypothetical protein
MPVLMVALLALAAFGGIGFLLALAVILEHRARLQTRQAIRPSLKRGKLPEMSKCCADNVVGVRTFLQQ